MINVGFYYPEGNNNSIRGIGFYATNLLSHIKINYSNRISISQINNLKNSNHYDIIHYPYFTLFNNTLPIKRSFKTIVTIHDAIPLIYPDVYKQGLKAKLILSKQKLALKTVDCIITDSLDSVNQIKTYLNVTDEKIHLIYLAANEIYSKELPLNLLKIVKKKYNLPDKFVLYTGDVNYNKNISTLVKSCVGNNINLVLVGKNANEISQMQLNHPELEHLKDVIPHILSKKVLTTGFVPDEDLAAIYKLASIYCQPSFVEGFGIPVLEAMSSGCPVLLSRDAKSLREIAQDSGVYFDANDQNDLTDKLIELLNSSSMLKELSNKVKNQSKVFSWNKTAENTVNIYESVLHHESK